MVIFIGHRMEDPHHKQSHVSYKWLVILFMMSVAGWSGCAGTDESDANLSAPKNSAQVGESLEMDASGNDYDTLTWYLDGQSITTCQDQKTCSVTFTTVGVQTVKIKVMLSNTKGVNGIPLIGNSLGGLFGSPAETILNAEVVINVSEATGANLVVLEEITPIPTPTNDTTPDYTFSSTKAGTITYGGLCTSTAITANEGNNTITFSTLGDATYTGCTITVIDNQGNTSNTLTISTFEIESSSPTLAEVTKIPALTSDTTPDYTFSSTEAGTITYGGSCSSTTLFAVVGNNVVTFSTLKDGSYSKCTLVVTDSAGNRSNVLSVTAFTVDSSGPVIAEVTAVSTPTSSTTPIYTFSTTVAGTITYGGQCASATTTAIKGNNTISFSTLTVGSYGECTITVTSTAGNVSNTLQVTSFTIGTPGFTVGTITGNTTEAGGTATFTLKLNVTPTFDVIIAVSSSNTAEGTVSPSSLTFTSANWSTAQTVTVTGVDDSIQDGNISYSIILGAASSNDIKYHGLDPDDVAVTNTDNDTIGVTVSAVSSATIAEATAGTAHFTVVLNTQPTSNVTLPVSSSNTAEATVSSASLIFTTTNWNVAQTITITAQEDNTIDGNQLINIVLAAISSSDSNYNNMNPEDRSVTVIDSLKTANLTAYYPFNGNANDDTSNANHGTVTNAALSTDRFNAANSAYDFNGTDAYINLGNNNISGMNSSVERTITAWFKPDVSSPLRLISRYENASTPNSNFLITINISELQVIGNGTDSMDSSGAGVTTVWTHIAVVLKNGANETKTYMNGSLIKQGTLTYNAGYSAVNTDIGRVSNMGGNYFDGKIDEVRIYSNALSAAEISNIYNVSKP